MMERHGMEILELVRQLHIDPRRASSNTYQSTCPKCEGNTRFVIWHKTGRYYCHVCKISGDVIQFCRDFLGMTFSEACVHVGKDMADLPRYTAPVSNVKIAMPPSTSWEDKAGKFIIGCHDRLLIDIPALNLVMERGLELSTIKRFRIGWNPVALYQDRTQWGFGSLVDDKEKKFYLPKGIVIPSFLQMTPLKIKIRRAEWKKGDPFAKYYQVPGGSNRIPIFGNDEQKVVILVEAELDAILVVQEAGDLCCCVALGGAQKRPDDITHRWLQTKDCILYALDYDEAGKKEYKWWKDTYRNLKAWPVPKEKSPGDAFKAGCNLNKWVAGGITICSSSLYSV